MCHIARGQRVLDGGCGVGVTVYYLARNLEVMVTGIDRYAPMIARVRERAEREGLAGTIGLQVADVEALPFEGRYL